MTGQPAGRQTDRRANRRRDRGTKWKLTGKRVLGIGDASGMLPIDSTTNDYDATMVEKFDNLIASKDLGWKILDILPKVLLAGENAGNLTEEGAKLLDPSGNLQAGAPLCPPEGDLRFLKQFN